VRHRGILAWRKWLAISLAGLGFAVGLAASTVPLDALRCSSKRFFISERLHFPHDSLG